MQSFLNSSFRSVLHQPHESPKFMKHANHVPFDGIPLSAQMLFVRIQSLEQCFSNLERGQLQTPSQSWFPQLFAVANYPFAAFGGVETSCFYTMSSSLDLRVLTGLSCLVAVDSVFVFVDRHIILGHPPLTQSLNSQTKHFYLYFYLHTFYCLRLDRFSSA